jgi:ATP-dependent Clp protease adaptor protein ClpS
VTRAERTESLPVLDEETERVTAQPPPWITLLWNCDCHTFEQVARQLVKAIGCSYDEGMSIARRVHTEGKAAVRVGPRAECERVARILAEIGLVVTVVEAGPRRRGQTPTRRSDADVAATTPSGWPAGRVRRPTRPAAGPPVTSP